MRRPHLAYDITLKINLRCKPRERNGKIRSLLVKSSLYLLSIFSNPLMKGKSHNRNGQVRKAIVSIDKQSFSQ